MWYFVLIIFFWELCNLQSQLLDAFKRNPVVLKHFLITYEALGTKGNVLLVICMSRIHICSYIVNWMQKSVLASFKNNKNESQHEKKGVDQVLPVATLQLLVAECAFVSNTSNFIICLVSLMLAPPFLYLFRKVNINFCHQLIFLWFHTSHVWAYALF